MQIFGWHASHLLKQVGQCKQQPLISIFRRNILRKGYHLFTEWFAEEKSLDDGIAVACVAEVLEAVEALTGIHALQTPVQRT